MKKKGQGVEYVRVADRYFGDRGWFALYARRKLVLAPEESFALSAHGSRDER